MKESNKVRKAQSKRSLLEADPEVGRVVDQTLDGRSKKNWTTQLLVAGMLSKGIRVPQRLARQYTPKAA